MIYRLQTVAFSLFRHPPRGGSADATFPRWGKERGSAQRPCRGAASRRPGSSGEIITNVRRIRSTSVVGRADPGAPGAATAKTSHHLRRIRFRPGRERRPRRSAQQRPRFPHLWANPQPRPRWEGACPFRQGMPGCPPTLGESANVSRIRPGFPVSARVLRGKGKPFPYIEILRIRRTCYMSSRVLRARPRA